MRKLIAILLTLALVLAMGSGVVAEERKTIAYSVIVMNTDYWYIMERAVAKACEDLGYDYVMQCHNADEAQMVSSCQNFIQQNVAGLVVSPAKPEAMGPIVAAAHAKGIPVVCADMGDGGTDDDGLVMSDNYGGGVLSANYILDLFEKEPPVSNKIGVIRLQPEAVISQLRCDSAIDVMTAAGYECVSDIFANSGTAEEGYKCMQDIIAAHPDIAAVFTGCDLEAIGAARAVADAGLTGVKIAGFDADVTGLEGVRMGDMACTVQQFSYDIGYASVVALDKLIRGETVEYDSDTNKEILVPCALVTKDDIPENNDDAVISITGLTRGELN